MTTSTPSNNSSGSSSTSSIKCNNSNNCNSSNNNDSSNNNYRQTTSAAAAAAVAAGAAAAVAVAAGAAAEAATATLYDNNLSATTAAHIGSTSTNRVMQADEDFNIRFVNLVRTHRCLYDKKVPEYRNRDNQEKAWALISTETCESVIHCKERWRNLRACLSRYIKQQSGSEPQHKPYYLTEHMAFLLPFLKSTRNSLDGNNSLTSLYQFSQQHLQLQHQQQLQQLQQHQQHQQEHLYCNNNNNLNTTNNNNIKNESMELKHSMSENDDEETIDAFDPAIAASLGLHRTVENPIQPASPAQSETASASSLQNFIPDVQLAESGQDLIYDDATSTPMRPQHHHHHQSAHSLNHHHQQQQQQQQLHQQSHFEPGSAKRIKTECEATTTTSGDVAYFGGLSVVEHTDMEFFRSILPDIAALTPQQRRKFKIGILELIDDVVERYPSQERYNGSAMLNGSAAGSSSGGSATAATGVGAAAGGGSGSSTTSGRRQRHNSARDWRK